MTLEKVHQEEGTLTKSGLEHTRQQLELLEEFVSNVLRKDQDYGVIPGTTKPTLLKPGAANIMAAFNCHAEPLCDNRTIEPEKNFVAYEYHVDVIHNGSGRVMARGYGECNSYEIKYRYRELKRACPQCDKDAIIKGKEEYGGGWVCWKKQGGCGAKYNDGDQVIEGQPSGRVENEDVMDQANTYMKMAIKRAEVDAALRLPGVARFFTQDLEDMQGWSKPEVVETTVVDAPQKSQPQPRPQKPKAEKPEKAEEKPPAFSEDDLRAWVKERNLEWDAFVEGMGLADVSWEQTKELGMTPAGARDRWLRNNGEL